MNRIWILLLLFVTLSCSLLEAGTNQWTSNGPFGGVILSFAFPQKNLVLAGGHSSIYRSTNGGKTWKNVLPEVGEVTALESENRIFYAGTDSLLISTDLGLTWVRKEIPFPTTRAAPFRVSAIAVHPGRPDVLYIMSGGNERTAGIFKSTDSGETWEAKNNGFPLVRPRDGGNRLVIHPQNGDVLYAISRRGVFKTTNGAESWKAFSSGLRMSPRGSMDLAIDPNSPDTLYAGSRAGTFKTTNGGKNWSRVFPNGFLVAIHPGNSEVAYLSDQTRIFKTTDGGINWNETGSFPFGQPLNILEISIHPLNPNHVFVGTHGPGIFRTTNGGGSWKFSSGNLTDNTTASITVNSTKNLLYAGTNSGSGMFSKPISGKVWKEVESDGGLSFVPEIAIDPKDGNIVYAVSACCQGIFKSTDAGKSFQNKLPELRFNTIVIDPKNSKTLYAGGDQATPRLPVVGIFKSTDQGVTWKEMNTGLSDPNVRHIAIDPRNPNRLMAATNSGIFLSTNGARSWKRSSDGLPEGIVFTATAHPSESNVFFAGLARNGIFVSRNGGGSWESSATGLDPVTTVRRIHFDPKDSRIVYAATNSATGARDGRGLLISVDGGTSWSQFDSNGLGTLSVADVAIDANRTLHTATEFGVFSYTPKSRPQAPVLSGLSPAFGAHGSTVTLKGSNFGNAQGNGTVTFNGVNVGTASSWSENSVVVTVPSEASTGRVKVNVSGGSSNGVEFVVLPSTNPGLTPDHGPSRGDTEVTIQVNGGGEFTTFQFGETLATLVRRISDNVWVVKAPPHAPGNVEVSLLTAAGSQSLGTFQYNP